MGKLARLLLVVAIIAVAVYLVFRYSGSLTGSRHAATDRPDERPRLEEKYGFTSETVGD